MNAVFARTVSILMLVIAILSGISIASASIETEIKNYTAVVNFFGSITDTHAYLGDTTKMQNGNKPRSGNGDIVTSGGRLFTVYMIAQGWPAVMCKPGESPNVVGSQCFVDEDVNLEDTLIYSAGVKNLGKGVSTSFLVREKNITINNESGTVTLSLMMEVPWDRFVCVKHGNETFCSSSEGTWAGWLSQTIPAPKEFRYNKTQNMTYNSSFLVKLANTPLTEEEFGFGMEGHVPSYSTSGLLENILLKDTAPKNESVNITLSYYKEYYRIVWDEKRQIYYGELINMSNPPEIETNRARIFYDYMNKTVSSLQMDNDTVLTKFWIGSPFGRKDVTVNVVETTETDVMGESIVPINVTVTLILVFFVIKNLIFGR